MSAAGQLTLFHFPIWGGSHRAAWRLPSTRIAPSEMFETHRRWARTCERGKLHCYFMADRLAIVGGEDTSIASSMPEHLIFDPATLQAALAACTDRIGLMITIATSYDSPFHVARRTATADHVSRGRVGWNVVTGGGSDDAPNFGMDRLSHEWRYARAEEFVDAVFALWDSFDDDAFVCDKGRDRFYDPAKVRAPSYRGELVSTRGPLNVARPVQGHPVIAQAGTSPPGQALAARIGEAVFNFAQTIEEGRSLRSDLHERMAEFGREPEDARFLPDVTLLVGRSEDEIEERLGQLDELVDVDRLLPDLSRFIGIDLSGYPLGGPVPEPPISAGGQTMQRTLVRAAETEQLTIKQLAERFARSIGHFVAATPATIADLMEEWLRAGAADGFVIRIADPEPSLDYLVDLVIPELQRRGIFRTEYRGATFREDLGLRRPPSIGAKGSPVAVAPD